MAGDTRTLGESDSLDARPTSRRWIPSVLLAVGALVVFAAHFRPWEYGFLEEWPLAEYWVQAGPAEFARQYAEWSLSRPLHLVPTGIGFLISGGALWGVWMVLGLVAAGQFLAIMWALRPVSRSAWISAGVALIVALHPLWPGGFLQRFLPAQAAALGMIVAAGFLIRWLLRGRIVSLLFGGGAVILGLLVYPGPALAAPLVAVVIVLIVPSSWRSRIIGVATIVAATALVVVYSFAITRWIAPGAASYEAGNLSAGSTGTPIEVVKLIARTLLDKGWVLAAGVAAVVVLAIVLGVSRAMSARAAALMAAVAVVSPLCSAVFFGNVAWLYDIDRIEYATSLGLIAALFVWPIAAHKRIALSTALAGVGVIAAVVGAVIGIARWQPYIALQHQLFAEVAPAMREANGDEIVVVIDHSGTYGTDYTLPQYYISSASHVMNDDDTRVWLCSLATDPPLGGAPVCDPAQTGDDLRLITSFQVPKGTVDVYIGTPESTG